MAKIITAEEISEMYEVVYKKFMSFSVLLKTDFLIKKFTKTKNNIFSEIKKERFGVLFLTLKLCTY